MSPTGHKNQVKLKFSKWSQTEEVCIGGGPELVLNASRLKQIKRRIWPLIAGVLSVPTDKRCCPAVVADYLLLQLKSLQSSHLGFQMKLI